MNCSVTLISRDITMFCLVLLFVMGLLLFSFVVVFFLSGSFVSKFWWVSCWFYARKANSHRILFSNPSTCHNTLALYFALLHRWSIFFFFNHIGVGTPTRNLTTIPPLVSLTFSPAPQRFEMHTAWYYCWSLINLSPNRPYKGADRLISRLSMAAFE